MSCVVDIAGIAGVVAALARGETRGCQAALAFAIRNRMAWHRDVEGEANSEGAAAHLVLAAMLTEAEEWSPVFSDLEEMRNLRAGGAGQPFNVVKEVWSGQSKDPTYGACRFHHHMTAPRWAENAEPSCLIGRWLFFPASAPAAAPFTKADLLPI